MGILGRLNNLIKSSLNELVDKVSDPAKEVDLLIVEMQEGLKVGRREVIAATAEAKAADRRVGECKEERDRWQRRAEQAVRTGDDELAREGLAARRRSDSDLQRANDVAVRQWAHLQELKQSLKSLEERLEEVQLTKGTLKQRARAAKSGDKGLSGARAFRDFDRLEERIHAVEEVSEVVAEDHARRAAAEAKFAKLERDVAVEDELAALKRKLDE